jgi:hypothetical protein
MNNSRTEPSAAALSRVGGCGRRDGQSESQPKADCGPQFLDIALQQKIGVS